MTVRAYSVKAALPTGEDKTLYTTHIRMPETRARPLDDSKIKEMETSIDKTGLLQPIGVRELKEVISEEGHTVEIIWGGHRFQAWKNKWNAAEEANNDKERGRWQRIPVVWYSSDITNTQAKFLELEENLVHNDLTPAQRKAFALEAGKISVKLKLQLAPKKETNVEKSQTSNQREWLKEWYAKNKIPPSSARTWWKEFSTATGLTGPARDNPDQEEAFFEWHQAKQAAADAKKEEKQKVESTAKEEKQTKDEFSASIRAELTPLIGAAAAKRLMDHAKAVIEILTRYTS